MEDLTLLIIYRRYNTAKWLVEDGLVTHIFTSKPTEAVENPVGVDEFFEVREERENALTCNGNEIIAAYLERRVSDENAPKGHRWEVLRRLS